MTTFTNISDEVLEPGKPIRSVDALALRDNPVAIAAGAANAPRVQTAAIADNAVSPAKILSPTAGNNIIYTIRVPETTTNNSSYTNILGGVTAINNGVIRVTFQHRSQFSSRNSLARVLRNGSQIQEFSTNSTSFVTRNVDVSISVGDFIEVQHRTNVSDSTSFLRNVRALSGNITFAVA